MVVVVVVVVVVSLFVLGGGTYLMSARQGKCYANYCAAFSLSPARDAHPRASSSSEGCKRIYSLYPKAGPIGNRLGHKTTANFIFDVFTFQI